MSKTWPTIPALCDELGAEMKQFIDDMGEAGSPPHNGNLFSEPAKSAIKRMQRMGALIRMIREKGEERST